MFLASIFLLVCLSHANGLQIAAVGQAELGEFRGFAVAADPSIANANGFALVGAKVTVNASQGVISGSLNVGKFALATPALKGDNALGFYFGVLGASASVDTTASTTTIAGAFAEVVAGFSQIFVWFEGNGQSGFQYDLGSDPNCSAAAATSDCIDSTGNIDMKSLTWTPFAYSNQSCGGGNYQANCMVHSFTTTGSLSGSAVAVFTFNVASEPVLVNNVKVGPDYGKIDVSISYPWGSKTWARSSPRVGILAAAAGKAAAALYNQQGSSSLFSWAGTGLRTFFSWDGAATINGASSSVYISGISRAQLDAFKCDQLTAYCIAANIRVGLLKLVAGLYAVGGWDVRLIWFTWNDVQPANVFWDPAIGATDKPQSSSGAFSSVSVYGVFVSVLVAWLFH